MYEEFKKTNSLVDLIPVTGQTILEVFHPRFVEDENQFKTDVLNWSADYIRTKLEIKLSNARVNITRLENKLIETKAVIRLAENPETATITVSVKGKKKEIFATYFKEELQNEINKKQHEVGELSDIIISINTNLADWEVSQLKTDVIIVRLFAEAIGIKGAYISRDIKSLANVSVAVNRFNVYSARHIVVSPKDGEYKKVKSELVSFLGKFTNENNDKANLKKSFPNLNGDEVFWLTTHVFNNKNVRFVVTREKREDGETYENVTIQCVDANKWEHELVMIVLYKLNGCRFGTQRILPN